MIKIIAAVGKNLELGKRGDLIWHLPNDLKFFKEQTTGCIVVMGRNTFNSLPRKLPNRIHYILTDSLVFNKDATDAIIYFDLEDLLKEVKRLAETTDVYIIGGASIYSQFVEHADELVLTEIDAEDAEADVYFPTFDKSKYEKTILAHNEDDGIKYAHVKYVRK